jgi:hypothetical protein
MTDQLASAIVNLLLSLSLLFEGLAAQGAAPPPTAPPMVLACETATAEQMEQCP